MPNHTKYARYTFRGRTGDIITTDSPGVTREMVTVGHTALVTPWSDPGVHLHQHSEEYYLLLQGKLRILVAGVLVSLKPKEILLVRPQVPHAIVGGEGPIKHIGIRAPAYRDKQPVGDIPQEIPPMIGERERELRRDWGYRIPLGASSNQNCWLIGAGTARFQSLHLILAFLNFPTTEAASAGIGTRHRLHLHQRSWEYYAVLKGTRTLQIENEVVKIDAGEVLEVPPQVCHTLYGRQPPCEGFTFRVPIDLHDKVECNAISISKTEHP